jgi:hypothetical protein
MLRHKFIACAIAVLFSGLAFADAVMADTIGDCCLTGYTFMGGTGAYVSTPSGSNTKDYFIAQPLYYDYYGDNYYGFGWLKFDNLATSAVDSAYLVFDLLGLGSMTVTPATPEDPGLLDIYDPGDIDVADLPGEDYDDDGYVLCATLRDYLYNDCSPLYDTLVMPSDGTYCVDITDVYNGWVNDPTTNHGLVFVSPGTKYASFGNADGEAPYISSVNLNPPADIPGTGRPDSFSRRRGIRTMPSRVRDPGSQLGVWHGGSLCRSRAGPIDPCWHWSADAFRQPTAHSLVRVGL